MWPFNKKPEDTGVIDVQLADLKKRIEQNNDYDNKLRTLPDEAKPFNAVANAGVIVKAKDRLWPDRSFLINMELRNGMHKTFVISTKKNYFKFMDGTYIIDQQCQYFNIDAKTYALDYHQDLSIPLKREVPVKEIQKTIKELSKIDTDQLVTAMNPYTVNSFIEGKVIEQLMKAQDIDAFFKNMRIIFIIILCECTAHLLLFMKASGMFSSMKIPGLG